MLLDRAEEGPVPSCSILPCLQAVRPAYLPVHESEANVEHIFFLAGKLSNLKTSNPAGEPLPPHGRLHFNKTVSLRKRPTVEERTCEDELVPVNDAGRLSRRVILA